MFEYREMIMSKKVVTLCLSLALVLATMLTVNVRPAQATTITSPSAELLATLPQSDAVMFVDVRRLLSETLPAMLAEHPELRARLDAEINSLNNRGFDVRLVDSLVVGFGSHRATEMICVLRGRFDANTVVAAIAAPSARRQTHNGRTLYTDSALSGAWTMTALDSNTLAFGGIERVRASIESFEGRGRVDAELVAQATRGANALVGFSGRVPTSLTQNTRGHNDELAQLFASIRQVSGSITPTESGGGEVIVRLRAENTDQAAEIRSLVGSIKTIAAQFPEPHTTEGTSIALPGLGLIVPSAFIRYINMAAVTSEGNEVSINLNFTRAETSALLRMMLLGVPSSPSARTPPPPARP